MTHAIAYLTPALSVLQRISRSEVEAELLEKLAAACWDGTTKDDLLWMLGAGELEAYTSGPGLILTQTIDHPKGRELFLFGIVGSGILDQAEKIMADLWKIARYKGCTMIGAEGLHRGWLKAAPALGFKPVSTRYVMEATDGR